MRRKARPGLPCLSNRPRKMRPAVLSLRIASSTRFRLCCDQPHCIRVDQQSGAQPLFKQAQQIKFVGEEKRLITDGQTIMHHFKAIGWAGLAGKNALKQWRGFGMRRFQ